MERDPKQVLELVQKCQMRRLVVIGDALHSMTPFKGQGANQALADGPFLASWLQRASIDSAVTGFWRETVQRTAPVVSASGQAAKEFHSPGILQHQHHGFAGVEPERTAEFLSVLREKGVGANLGAKLDERVAQVIAEFQVAVAEPARSIAPEQQTKALEFAASGDTQGLRQLSLAKHSESIRTAKDVRQRTCLHLAAQGGHTATCKWLLTEVDCESRVLDEDHKTPKDYALEKADESILCIFEILEKERTGNLQ
jgi:hypothetical protein